MENIRSKFDTLLDFNSENLTQEKLKELKLLLEKRDEKEIVFVHFSIGDGGVSFSMTDSYGPTLTISSSHFGNNSRKQVLHLSRESLSQLRQFFEVADKADYSEEYVYPLRCSEMKTPEQKREGDIYSAVSSINCCEKFLKALQDGDFSLYPLLQSNPEMLSSMLEEQKDDLAKKQFNLLFLNPSNEELEKSSLKLKEDSENPSRIRHIFG